MSRKSKHCAWKARQRRSLSESVERLEDRRLLAADIGDAYGRKPVDANDWPFVVGFVSSGSVGCGGTLIAPNAVLTAAHCVADGETDQTAVLVGSQRIQVAEVVVHPDFDAASFEADIAVLLLDSAVAVEPASIAGPDTAIVASGVEATALGWRGAGGFSQPKGLHAVSVPIVDNEIANDVGAYDGRISDRMLAAGGLRQDTCLGDSGGPLMVQRADRISHVIGITSWGRGCGTENFPGVYTRVSSFQPWIESVINSGGERSQATNASAVAEQVLGELKLPSHEASDANQFGQGRACVLPSPVDEILEVGPTIQGTVSPTACGKIFQFDVRAGFEYELLVNITGEDHGGIYVLLYDEYIDVFRADSRVRGTISITWLADADETLFLYLTDHLGFGIPTYELTVNERVNEFAERDDHGDAAATATPIQIDDTTSGRIELVGDRDWYAFNAEAGATYRIAAESKSFAVRLFAPDQKTHLHSTSKELVWMAPESAEYFVKVYHSTLIGRTGSYEFRVERVDLAQAANISVPSTVGGELRRGEFDYYGIDVDAGKHYRVSTAAGNNADLALLGFPHLTYSKTSPDRESVEIIFTAEESETLFIRMDSYDIFFIRYDISVEEVTDGIGDSFANAATLDIPSTVESSIDFHEDKDLYRFTVVEGVPYRVEAEALTANYEFGVAIRNEGSSSSIDLDFGEMGEPLMLQWIATQTDDLFVEAFAAAARNGYGAYKFDVRIDDLHGNESTSASSVAIGESVGGAVDAASDVDWFRFDAQQGVGYRIASKALSASSTKLAVRDASGNIITTMVGEVAQVNWLAPSSGDYYATVEPADQTSFPGGYELTIDSVAGDANLDGVFNSSDLIQLFAAAEYEDGFVGNSTWEEGDFNGDGDFTSADLVLAFTKGIYSRASHRARLLECVDTDRFDPRRTEPTRIMSRTSTIDAAFAVASDDAEQLSRLI